MANSLIGNVARYFSIVEINTDKKHGEAKWRKVVRPSFLVVTSLFIMVMLFLCNAAVNELYIGSRGKWNAAGFESYAEHCSDQDEELYNYLPLKNEATNHVSLGTGTKSLPRDIVEATTDLELRHLWMPPQRNTQTPQNLLAIAVGIKQKITVDKIVQKFPADNFTVMLFHYDGKVDNWTDLGWSASAIHVMAFNQTKWWFAKRFLHPDVVHKYNYIFLWDEDLGVEHFHAGRYLDIMEDEGFEISQPALHHNSSEVHHRLTVLNRKARAHRRIYSYAARHQCDGQSNGPPCTGWVEMMAPVFSRAAWRCTWNMIQESSRIMWTFNSSINAVCSHLLLPDHIKNDLVHAWGLDYKLGYCAQGTRSEKVGVIDTEFIVHEGIPSLGGPKRDKAPLVFDDENSQFGTRHSSAFETDFDLRTEIRKRARSELDAFARKWRRSAANDPEWEDPYKPPELQTVEVPAENLPTNKQEVRSTQKKKQKRTSKTTPGPTQIFKTSFRRKPASPGMEAICLSTVLYLEVREIPHILVISNGALHQHKWTMWAAIVFTFQGAFMAAWAFFSWQCLHET